MNNYPIPKTVEESLKPAPKEAGTLDFVQPRGVVPRGRPVPIKIPPVHNSRPFFGAGTAPNWDAPDAWNTTPAPVSAYSAEMHRFTLRNNTDEDKEICYSTIEPNTDAGWQKLVTALKIHTSLKISRIRVSYNSFDEMDRDDRIDLDQEDGFGNKASLCFSPRQYQSPMMVAYQPMVDCDFEHVIAMGFSISTHIKARSHVGFTFFYSAIQR